MKAYINRRPKGTSRTQEARLLGQAIQGAAMAPLAGLTPYQCGHTGPARAGHPGNPANKRGL